jgi:hypothetical protein
MLDKTSQTAFDDFIHQGMGFMFNHKSREGCQIGVGIFLAVNIFFDNISF